MILEKLAYSDEEEDANVEEYSSSNLQKVNDDWEKIDEKEYAVNQVITESKPLLKNRLLQLKVDQLPEKTLFTSTPSNDKIVMKTPITRDQNDFNKILIENADTSEELENVINQNQNKSETSNNTSQNIYGKGFELAEGFQSSKGKKNNIDIKYEPTELTKESKELCEKILILMSTLVWEGVVGSNEDAWKVKQYLFL